MNIQNSYNRWSTTYDLDENLTRDLDQEVTSKELVDLHFDTILELGCGTGKNTAFLSQIGQRVFSLDFSEGMIAKAREKLRSDNVFFHVGNIEDAWPCKVSSIGLVTCNLVLEHIEDLSHVFSEAYRALVKGGSFFICELHPFRQYQGKKARFESGNSMIEINAFTHHISDFITTAEESGFALKQFREWWHSEDQGQLPRLASFMFQK
jgi:malonyl-CoA O-methyltransferase